MNNETLYVPVYSDEVRMIAVVFANDAGVNCGAFYTYKCGFECKEGDHIVVEAKGWMQVVTVVNANVTIPMDSDIKYRWAVCKVDKTDYDSFIKWERDVIETINNKKVENMRLQMQQCIGISKDELMLDATPEEEGMVIDDTDKC